MRLHFGCENLLPKFIILKTNTQFLLCSYLGLLNAKKHVALISCIILSTFLYGQEEFSFQLAFSDGLENQDTLILGYDSQATDSIDEDFGETNIITQPWESNLDVRSITHYYPSSVGSPTFHSKKQIIAKTCDFDFKILIGIKVVNYPLRITWDTTLFQTDSCRMASILSCCAQLETDFYLGPSIFLSNLYPSLLHSGDTLIIDAATSDMISTYSAGNVDILLFWLSFANPSNFSTTSIDEADMHGFQIFPNPTISYTNYSCSEEFLGGTIQVCDILGNVLWEDQISAKRSTIPIFSSLSSGTYMVKLSNGSILHTQKVIKH